MINTPIREYDYNGYSYWVKREDLSFDPPAPPFSKNRGLIVFLEKLKQRGFTTVGYTETSISMAGIGVCWAAEKLGMKAVIFDPIYKKTPYVLKQHRKLWKQFNPVIIPIKAGMAKVNYYVSKRILEEKYGKEKAFHLPLGLPFSETVDETARVAEKVNNTFHFNTIIVCVGSGTIAAGVARGFSSKKVIGVMCRTGNIKQKLKGICLKGRFMTQGFSKVDFHLVDPGYEYTDKTDIDVPFPCHPYYDAKAFEWMVNNINNLKTPILFWNIGALPYNIGNKEEIV